jgi:TolB protein
MRVQAYTLAALLLLVLIGNDLQVSGESPRVTIVSLADGDWVEGEVEIIVGGDVENLELVVNGTVVSSANAGESLIWDTRDENATSPALFQVVVRGELENGTEVESSPVNVTVLYPRQLTYDTAMDIQPEWHPGGEIFVFKSNRGEEDHIFKLYTLVPGEEPVLVQTDRIYHGYPGWSPDGSQMVFNSYDPEIEGTGEMDIFVVNLSSGESIPVTANSDFDDSGRWSPDGNFISFHSSRSGDLDVWKVAVAENGTPIGEPVRLTPGDSNEHCPRWSFDGEWLVYETDREEGTDVWVMRADGSDARQITNDDYDDGYPGWSPAGDWLVYDSVRDDNTDIYLIPIAGGPQKRVTMHHTDDRHASWSPDGRSLLFHSGRGGDVNIWQVEIPDPVVNIDETGEDSGDSVSCPAFVDGENLEEIDDACVATFDDEGELEPSELEDILPGISIVSTLGLITLIAFLRRKSYV